MPQEAIGYSSILGVDSLKTNMKSSSTVSATVEQESSTSDIPTADVQRLIKQVRNAVCNSIGDADVRVWTSIDASGKLLGVGETRLLSFP